MPKLSYIAYITNNIMFPLLWVFMSLLLSVQFVNIYTQINLQYSTISIIIFVLASICFSYATLYFFIYEFLGRVLSNKLGSLLFLPSLLGINNYYMGNFGGGGGPSYQSVAKKYNEWIQEVGVLEKIIIWKKKKNQRVFFIFALSVILALIGLAI